MKISNIRNMIQEVFSGKADPNKSDPNNSGPNNHGVATNPLKKEDNIMVAEGKNSDVTIYSLSTCSHCKAAKKFLGECAIKYEFIDVDLLDREERMAILEDVRRFNPRCSFPTIVIGNKVIVGYREDEIKEALGL